MATYSTTYYQLLTNFNTDDGTYTGLNSAVTSNRTFDEDLTNTDTNDTMSVDDGALDGVRTYTGYTINGYPVIKKVSATYLYHNEATGFTNTAGTADATSEFVLCFAKDTLITTSNGSVPIQELKLGDSVLCADNTYAPVKFILQRAYKFPFYTSKNTNYICIRQHAFAENSPNRDLYVSPEHALLVDGVFTQAHALINGSSIFQVRSMPNDFTYYHLELENHALIYAENVLAETYIDNVARATFDNYAEYLALYPEAIVMQELTYPRAKSARQLPRKLKQKLLTRAINLGVNTKVA